jgi:hypothetical protein
MTATGEKDEALIEKFNDGLKIISPSKGFKVQLIVYSGRDIPEVDFIPDDSDVEDDRPYGSPGKTTKDRKEEAPNRKRIHKNVRDDNESDEEGDHYQGNNGHSSLDYFSGVTGKVKDVIGRNQMEIDDFDESIINYLHSDIALNSLRAKNVAKFEQIFLLLKEKFCVALYGFGSKRKLLCSFTEKFLRDEHYLMVNGYCPGLSYQDIVNNLSTALEAENTTRESLLDAARDLDQDFFLVIHSMDQLFGNSIPRVKDLITDLIVQSDGNLHLLGSIDHLNSAFLFDSSTRTKIDLVWMETRTFLPYTVERGYKSSATDNNNSSQVISLNSVIHVYESLTPNAQKIFLQILDFCVAKKQKIMQEKQKELEVKASKKKQKQEKEKKEKRRGKPRRRPIISDDDEEPQHFQYDSSGDEKSKEEKRIEDEDLPLSTLYSICREEYLVNSEITLKAQLTEFQDHNIIKVAKAADGSVVIRLNLKLDLAQSFLIKMKEGSQ